MENENLQNNCKMKSSADNIEQNTHSTHRTKRKWWEIRKTKKNEEKTQTVSHARSLDSTVASYFLLKDSANDECVEITSSKEDSTHSKDVSLGDAKFAVVTSNIDNAKILNYDGVKQGDACRVIDVKPTFPNRKAHSKVFDNTHKQEKQGKLHRPQLNQITQHSTLNHPGGNHHAFTKSVGYSSKDAHLRHPYRKLRSSSNQAVEQETDSSVLQRKKGFTKEETKDEADTSVAPVDASNTDRFQEFEDDYEEEMAYRFPTLYRRLAIMKAEDPNLIPQVNMMVPKAKVPYDNPNLRVISPCHEHKSNRRHMSQSGVGSVNSHNRDLENLSDDNDHLLQLQGKSPSKYLRKMMRQRNNVTKLINAKSQETVRDEIQCDDQNSSRNSSPGITSEESYNKLKCSPAKTSIAIKGDDQLTQEVERLITELVTTETKSPRRSSLQYSRHGQSPDDVTKSLEWLLGEVGM